ncbi:hypothetical protein [Vibrio sp. 10N.261.52.A1]|uniref:hypothetical protein n=1 Tax=Vibrio TaxID=662 RepID=UPI000C8222B9|nr:hypothetical protein [Vibrio sp. 10N.261.52.A1]PML64743.1 hypothetical protein BCT81_06755 [Vibrio sp. 10N.261.52.A1]
MNNIEQYEVGLVLILLIISFISTWMAVITDKAGLVEVSLVSQGFVLTQSWDTLIKQLYLDILALAPEMDPFMSVLVAGILTAIVVLVPLAAILFSPFPFIDDNGKISLKYFLSIFARKK